MKFDNCNLFVIGLSVWGSFVCLKRKKSVFLLTESDGFP